MRTLNTIFILCAFCLHARAQVFEVSPEDTHYITQKMHAGQSFYSLRDDLLGGTWVLYYDKEKTRKIEQCSYKKELRHGEHIKWYLNGQMKSKVTWHEGEKAGKETTWYENGQKKVETSAHSISDTVCDRKEWYKTGELLYDEKRDGNKKLGTVYYKDGKVKCKRVEVYTYDETVLLPRYKVQQERCVCKNGNVIFDADYSQPGKVLYRDHHCNGNVKSEGMVIGSPDYKVGEWTYYRIDGTKKMSGTFKDGDTRFDANIREGNWYYMDGQGKITKTETYKDGKLVGTSMAE